MFPFLPVSVVERVHGMNPFFDVAQLALHGALCLSDSVDSLPFEGGTGEALPAISFVCLGYYSVADFVHEHLARDALSEFMGAVSVPFAAYIAFTLD